MNEKSAQETKLNHQEEKGIFITVTELFDMWETFLEAYETAIDSAKTKEDRRRAYESLHLAKDVFVKDLIRGSEKFKRVFKTEKDSVYVQTGDGKTIRFKKFQITPDVSEYRIQSPSNFLFFVNPDVAQDFAQTRDSIPQLVGKKFVTTDYRLNTQPIEFMPDQDIDEYFLMDLLLI